MFLRWILSALFILVLPIDSYGFKRETSKIGVPLRWMKMPVHYVIDSDGLGSYFAHFPRLGVKGSEKSATVDSFKTWLRVRCGGLPLGLQVLYGGEVTGKKVGFDQNCLNCNTNLIIFRKGRDAWKHDRLQIALTTTAFNNGSGELLDADIEVNGSFFELSTQIKDAKNIIWDLQGVMTHEVGHFLGLDHSAQSAATMNANGQRGTLNMRSLDKDDIGGMCSIYPPKKAIGDVPKYQQVQSDRALGCSAQSGNSSDNTSFPTAFFAFITLLFLSLVRRR